MNLDKFQDLFGLIWNTSYTVLNVLLADCKANLLEYLLIQSVPVVSFLRDGVGLTVVVKVDDVGDEMLYYFCH